MKHAHAPSNNQLRTRLLLLAPLASFPETSEPLQHISDIHLMISESTQGGS